MCRLLSGVTKKLGRWPPLPLNAGRQKRRGSHIIACRHIAEEHHMMASSHGMEVTYPLSG